MCRPMSDQIMEILRCNLSWNSPFHLVNRSRTSFNMRPGRHMKTLHRSTLEHKSKSSGRTRQWHDDGEPIDKTAAFDPLYFPTCLLSQFTQRSDLSPRIHTGRYLKNTAPLVLGHKHSRHRLHIRLQLTSQLNQVRRYLLRNQLNQVRRTSAWPINQVRRLSSA